MHFYAGKFCCVAAGCLQSSELAVPGVEKNQV